MLRKYKGAMFLWLWPLAALTFFAGLYGYAGITEDPSAAEQCRPFFWLYLTVLSVVLTLWVYAEVSNEEPNGTRRGNP